MDRILSMLRRRRSLLLLSASLFVVLLLFHEIKTGFIFMRWMNRYRTIVYRPITVQRQISPVTHRIAIFIILLDTANAEEYADARATVECYAALQSYPLHVIDISMNSTLLHWCQQEDFMFRRHCVLSHVLAEKKKEVDWALFIDADMAVINPNHLIEDYLPARRDVDVVFYERIFNHEVMAGSYLVRNTEQGRRFLSFWADYSTKLPNSFHGTDNGALHMVILEFALPNRKNKREICARMWRRATDYDSLAEFVVCVREVLRRHRLPGFEIRPKNSALVWARDGWLTESLWATNDFFLHGWQKRRRDHLIFARWHSPLVLPSDSAESWSTVSGRDYGSTENSSHPISGPSLQCLSPSHASLHWPYKDSFLGTNDKVKSIIHSKIDEISSEYAQIVGKLKNAGYS